jgi:signal transduction histidine kinase
LHGQVQQADRLSALGTLAASLTHEIRNPLSSISLFLAMLPQRHQEPAFVERFTRVVGQEVEKLSQLANQMLTYAKPTVSEQALDLVRLAERTRQLMAYHFAKRRVQLSLQAEGEVVVQGSEAEISQVLVNLLLNALEASAPEQKIHVRVAQEGVWAVLEVTDQGHGMNDEQQAQLFQPYFTTKESGTGLGLATSRRIVQAAGGQITVRSASGQGATFRVTLPLVFRPARTAATAVAREDKL